MQSGHRKTGVVQTIPEAGLAVALKALQASRREGSILGALRVFHGELGDVFRLPLPVFRAVMLVGPEANRFVLVTGRDRLLWRPPGDPVQRLLRRGVLVTDGDEHTALRRLLGPPLHKARIPGYAPQVVRWTDQVTSCWDARGPLDMLNEMRRVALLILTGTLFDIDLTPDLDRLWPAILRVLRYISPGAWMVWRGTPQPGITAARNTLDGWLHGIILERRVTHDRHAPAEDLLTALVRSGLPDARIRDQLLTMLIAGHDTSTALLAWALYLLGRHPEAQAQARAEVDAVVGADPPDAAHLDGLRYLGRVIDETLRLYPPIHLGQRVAAVDLTFGDYSIPAGTRVLYSIFLTHRHPAFWPDPDAFDPDRFLPERRREQVPYAYLPFGGGPRNCLGMAFAQAEAKLVLARLLQGWTFAPEPRRVSLHMGATLEPRMGHGAGVLMRVRPRAGSLV